jgi:hypothetical protein
MSAEHNICKCDVISLMYRTSTTGYDESYVQNVLVTIMSTDLLRVSCHDGDKLIFIY